MRFKIEKMKSRLNALADLMLWSTILDCILLVMILAAVICCWWRLCQPLTGARLLINGEVWGGRAYSGRVRNRIRSIESEW